MSTIGSVSGFDPSQLEWLQQLRAQQGTQSAAPRVENLSTADRADHIWSMLSSRTEALGMDATAISDLQDEVKEAVMTALDSADSSDPKAARAAVHDAILSTLEANGIDTEALKADMATFRQHGPGGPGGPGGAGGPPPPTGEQGTRSQEDETSEESSSSLLTASDFLQQLAKLFPLVDEQA